MQERARESIVEQRQHEEHLKETMQSRAEAEMTGLDNTEIEEAAREGMVEQRRQESHLQETMLSRSTAEIGVPPQTSQS